MRAKRTVKLLAVSYSGLSGRKRTATKIFIGLFLVGLVGFVLSLNNYFLISIPSRGGELTEGVVGTPRFVNPLLAVSDADRDLSALIYSGLLRADEHGRLIPDLAQSYDISDDGKTYTFYLKRDLTWHDGEPVTAGDIIFTIGRAKDSTIKSPKRPAWEGVATEKIDDFTVRFHLGQAYAGFADSATLGILPAHLWQDVSPEAFTLSNYNLDSIGSGPYKIKNIAKDKAGIPEQYELVPFDDFALGKPKIASLKIAFYPNEEKLLEAYEDGQVSSINAISPKTAVDLKKTGTKIITSPLPRVFGVFFNQNQSDILARADVRKALDLAINRQVIIDQVLLGYGQPLSSPIPPGSIGYTKPKEAEADYLAQAKAVLSDNDWELNDSGIWQKGSTVLTFSLVSPETPELKMASDLIVAQWRELGAQVNLQVYEVGDLNQNVIRPRKFDALFFGEIIAQDSDLFSFWHSSQRFDPGLNITMYTNLSVDELLSQIRATDDPKEREEKIRSFATEISADRPAVFVYSPDFIYVLPEEIRNAKIGPITTPANRFSLIHQWYITTEKVWEIFNK